MQLRAVRLCLLAAALLAGAAPVSAQRQDTTTFGRIVGRVIDAETGAPVEGVSLRLTTVDRPAQLSDRTGRFHFDRLPRGIHEIVIEHVAYGRGSQLVNVPPGERVDFEAALRPHAIALDSLVITAASRASSLARSGFLERQRRGWGKFYRDEPAMSARITQIVRRVPRMEIVPGYSGGSTRVIVRNAGLRGACSPGIWIDGFLQRWAEGDIEAAVFGLDIEAIEIYRGLDTPPEFQTLSEMRPCGAIVVWTRR